MSSNKLSRGFPKQYTDAPTKIAYDDELEVDEDRTAPPITSSGSGYDRSHNPDSMWSQQGSIFTSCDKALATLPPGFYNANSNHQIGYYLVKKELDTDQLIYDLDPAAREIASDIGKFYRSKDLYESTGYLWKRGYMLYGPPGTGKTSIIQSMCHDFIYNRKGIVIFNTYPEDTTGCLNMVRAIEPDTPILVIHEEIEQIIKEYGEHALLSLLDGEHQVDNIIHIATTNYPENLDARILNRPARFDRLIYVNVPALESRVKYLQAKTATFDIASETIDMWARKTEGMSYAHLKEVIVGCLILGDDFETVITRLEMMMKGRLETDSGYERKRIGFG